MACRDCQYRQLLPLSDEAIYGHLAGEHTIGLYPLRGDDRCHLLAVDFDEQDWRDDARAFMRSCQELAVPAALEISRSGEGAHAWMFFEEAVSAREARQLGAALISHTCSSTRQLELSSYDRLFPNQDTLPKGGFGNLIALPLLITPGSGAAACSWMTTCTPIAPSAASRSYLAVAAACAYPRWGVISRAYRRHRHCCWPMADLIWLESVNRC